MYVALINCTQFERALETIDTVVIPIPGGGDHRAALAGRSICE
ncbi:MAG: hypothetical protein AB1331_00010 [Bacillota bacterium]